uniref:Calcineurin-like phosphoesterase domain-containing protein n=1 Tax=Thermosporothrix sp. COM3 TaxID=2490863 RepID=A0A455SW69_9CHLR|nr:hypothetical protein KTC_61000 [Thermosporothrix sp. COM3]
MKVALIADIHGNRVALDAALADIKRSGADMIVCLGDVVGTGPQPQAVLERLQALVCPVVMGNTDEWALRSALEQPEDEEARRIEELDLWECTAALYRREGVYTQFSASLPFGTGWRFFTLFSWLSALKYGAS